jgi:cell division transport system permease protein
MSSVSGISGNIEEPRPDGPVAERREQQARPPMFRFSRAPLFPEAGSGGAPLTAVIAVISSLAALALAAFLLIAGAAETWTAELKSSVTIQVKGADLAEIEARTAQAAKALEGSPHIIDFKIVNSAEAGKLLEPWLGKGNTDGLNVPALIELRLTDEGRRNLDSLQQTISAADEGLAIDDHGDWNARLARAARSGQALAFAIFALIMAAASAISIFAARAGLAANAEVVSLLHLVGATDDFIANEVQRRFTIIGLRGSAIGLAIALFALGLFALATRSRGADAAFLPGLSLTPEIALPMLAVPIAICLATAIAARYTVLRTLRETY